MSFGRLLLQQRTYTDPTSFATEMAAEGVGARKPSPTSPDPAGFEIPATNKFLLARVESFVAFPIMLPSKRLGTYRTHERAFVRVRAKVGP